MPRLTLPKSHRLTHDLEFKAVYDARVRKIAGALAVSCKPNSLAHHRLGLSVGKAVGNAVVRTRCKRLCREAFRLVQHELVMHEFVTQKPASDAGVQAGEVSATSRCGFDIVMQVRSADVGGMEDVKTALLELVKRAQREWAKRAQNS